jgi:hypothetical protein
VKLKTAVKPSHTIVRACIATLAIGLALAGTAHASHVRAQHTLSEALNRNHAPLRALAIRSEALNRKYGLGGQASGGSRAQAAYAIRVRGEALNQRYHLGRYAVVRVGNSFDWSDAGIGATAMLGAVLVASGLIFTVRRPSPTDATT